MAPVVPPKGLICALVTPLTRVKDVDRPSLRRLVDSIIEDVDGMLIGSPDTGEGFALNNSKRVELARAGMETVKGKVPLLLHITGDTLDQTADNISQVELARDKFNYKGDIFLLDCPLWYHSNRGLPANYEELRKLTGLQFILYNNPSLIKELKVHFKRRNIRTNILKRLSENEQIVGIVHIGDLKRSINYLRAVRRRPDFRFYDGDELGFLARPSSGGVVSCGANILASQWGQIITSSLTPHDPSEEDPVHLRKLWQLGQELRQFHAAYARNPAPIIKAALKHLGIIDTNTIADRTPTISPDQARRIHDLLLKYKLLGYQER